MKIFKYIFILISLTFCGNLTAQTTGVAWRFGVNSSYRTSMDNEEKVSSIGTSFGGIVELPIADILSIQPEFHFWSKSYGSISNLTTFKVKRTFSEIPINAKLHFGSDAFRVFLLAGPSVGFSKKGDGEICFQEECQEIEFNFGENSDSRGFDLSLSAGAGFALVRDNGEFFIDVRTLRGMINIAKNGNNTGKYRSLNIGLGYKYNFGA